MTAAGARFEQFKIPLARCTVPKCKRWTRVLPLEFLPYKTYGIDVIEIGVSEYINTANSYRGVAAGIAIINGSALAHTSLYYWITGLGERVLDRSPLLQKDYPPNSSAVIAQTNRLMPNKQPREHFLNAAVKVFPDKYRSERRRDQLEAVQRLLIVAALLFGAMYKSLQKWNELLLPSFFVAVWAFPSAYRGTYLQQAHPP